MYNQTYDLKCNDCEHIVKVIGMRELTEDEKAELQARIRCQDCLKKMLSAKQ